MRMRRGGIWSFELAMMVAALCIAEGVAQSAPVIGTPPLTEGQKFRIYLRQTYSVAGVAFPAAFAGLNQWADSPREWGQDGDGYLKRFATQRGQFQIGAFCGFAAGSLLHEDPRFFPSHRRGFLPRTRYVLTHTFVARTDHGATMPAFANYAAAIGAGFAPAAWLPRSANTVTSSLGRTAAMVGMNIGMNMGIEFGPDDRRFFAAEVLRRPRHKGQAEARTLP